MTRDHRTRPLGAPALALFTALALLPASGSAAERIRLSYTLYVGYLSALDVTATVSLGDGRYRIEALVAPQSWIAWALPWTARFLGEGRIEDGAARPEHHQVASTWGHRSRKTEIDQDADGTVRVAFDPPVQDAGREPVPDPLRTGTIDPVSAVAALSEAARGDRGCPAAMPMFDGRRRFDIQGERLPDAAIPASRYSAYAGPSTVCRLTFSMVAGGYRDGERSRFWQAPKAGRPRPPAEVWLARPRPDLPPLPVYAIGESVLGWVTVYLSAVAVEAE